MNVADFDIQLGQIILSSDGNEREPEEQNNTYTSGDQECNPLLWLFIYFSNDVNIAYHVECFWMLFRWQSQENIWLTYKAMLQFSLCDIIKV